VLEKGVHRLERRYIALVDMHCQCSIVSRDRFKWKSPIRE